MRILDFGFWILDCAVCGSATAVGERPHPACPDGEGDCGRPGAKANLIHHPGKLDGASVVRHDPRLAHDRVHRSAQGGCGPRAAHLSSLVPHRSSHRGITLLEVLISIGVLSVGVLGAASLLPMATYFQNETTNYDRGGALAQQAVHDLQIKNYLSPRRWLFVDPSNTSPPLGVEGIVGLTGTFASPNANYTPFSAFVIDPLGFSYVFAIGNNPGGAPSAPFAFPCYFPAFVSQAPYPTGTAPTIYRAGITANDYWPPAATMPVASPLPMAFVVADRLMRSNDDVLFYTPAYLPNPANPVQQLLNADQRPTAIAYSASAPTATAQTLTSTYAPNFTGDFSWIATVSRPPSDMVKGPAAAADLHRFQVSVVVLKGRDLTLWASGLTPEQPPPERQVYAMLTQYGGQSLQGTAPFYGGGGLQLYVYEGPSTSPGSPSRHWLDNIKPNTYLMLSSNFATYLSLIGPNGPVAGPTYPFLAWYRIINVDDGPSQDTLNTSRWYRNLTVTGSDWQSMYLPPPNVTVQNWYGVDPNAPNAIMPLATAASATPQQAPVVFCALMDDAIAEFDDIITLDYSLVRQ